MRTRDPAHLSPWWRSPLLFMAAVCLALAWAFATFASEVVERELHDVDAGIRAWVVSHRSGAGLAFFRVVTWLGSTGVLVIAAVFVGGILVRRGARVRPLALAVAPFLFSAIVRVLKRLFAVVRPPTGVAEGGGFSFPSGHSAMSMAVAIVLAYVLVREGVASRGALVAAVVVALLVGVSRVYLDMHWFSDVLGGWVVGATFGTGCCALYEHAHRRAARLDHESADRRAQG